MTKTVTSPYDVAEHLRTPEEMAAYLEASIEEADGDAAFVARALGDIARAKGMSQVAVRCRPVPRKPLQGAFGRAQPQPGHCSQGASGALGLKLRAEAAFNADAAGQGASDQPPQ